VLLILAGVFGGLLAFGIIGLFIGPVILAVAYTLLRAWVSGTMAPVKTEPENGVPAADKK
jgi:predicted PurR-regulated permease PerM